MKKGLMIDMDGVIYAGEELIKGAEKFVKRMLDKDINFLFLSNNSQRSRREDYAAMEITTEDPRTPFKVQMIY